MHYLVKGYTSTGAVELRRVRAETTDEARALSGLSPRRILSVRESYMGALKEELTKVRVPEEDQVLVLSSLSAMAISGQNLQEGLITLVEMNRRLKKFVPEIEPITLVSERLKTMNFDSSAVLLAEVGESSGNLGQALRRAAEDMMARKEMLANLTKGMLFSVVLFLISAIVMIVVPLIFGPLVRQFQEMKGVTVPVNFGTHILLFVSDAFIGYWYVMLAAVIGIFFSKSFWWPHLKKIPPFTGLDEYFKIGLGLRFMSVYKTLYESGVKVEKAVEQLAISSRRSDRAVFRDMLERVRSGGSLSEIVRTDKWSQVVKQGLQGFENTDRESRFQILDSIVDLLNKRGMIYGARVSRVLYIVGICTGATAVALMIFGGYLPLNSIKM